MFTQKSIKIFHSVQEVRPFSLFQNLALGKASTDDKCHFAIPWARSCQYQCVCKSLSKYSTQFKRKGHFHFFRIWTSATPRPIPNDIWQSLGLHLVNINAYANFYQNIQNGLRVIDIFHEQAGVKIFTNTPASKSSQTVWWQNQMLDLYRALYEIQLQVSVDFLRVVQFRESDGFTESTVEFRMYSSTQELTANPQPKLWQFSSNVY